MGSLRKRGGVWWLRWYDRNGKRHELSGGKKKGRALKKLRLIEVTLDKGEPWSPAFERYRFDDAVTDIVNDTPPMDGAH